MSVPCSAKRISVKKIFVLVASKGRRLEVEGAVVVAVSASIGVVALCIQ